MRLPILLVPLVTLFLGSQSAAEHVDLEDYREGRALVEHFQCHRCHQGTGLASPPMEKSCVGCHQSIVRGDFEGASPELLASWRASITHLKVTPSLSQMDQRFHRDWLARFLQQPHDLRPRLGASMPRFEMSSRQARRIAAYFIPKSHPQPQPSGDVELGQRLFNTKGCGTCHRFSGTVDGVVQASEIPVPLSDEARLKGLLLAPDLSVTRSRFRLSRLSHWIQNPTQVKPDTWMPVIPMTAREAEALAAFIANTPLTSKVTAPTATRLPVLKRPVRFDEVNDTVFRKVCWHCHSDPDFADGDGGPGNTGGFGFAGRRISFASFEEIIAGGYDVNGVRKSLATPTADGTPWLVAALLARRAEEAGASVGEVRGMPLGLPSLSLESIQLVETWIVQGQRRR